MPENINYLVTLTPEQIVKHYESKGLKFSWDWRDTWEQVHAKVFTVAKVMKLDILQDIKDAVNQSLKDGLTYRQFANNIEPTLKTKGWWGKVKAKDVPGYEQSSGIDPEEYVQLGSPRRLKNIYSTNSRVAYNAGRYKSQIENIIDRPYGMYIQLQRKSKRDDHAKLHEKVFRLDDPIWQTIYPPNGFHCACRVRALSKNELKKLGLSVSKGSDFDFKTAEGWDYNPGEAAFFPNLDNYDYDIAVNYVAGGLTGPDFQEFYDEKVKGNFPIAVIDSDYQKLINANTKTVYLSDNSLQKNKREHPELDIHNYQIIPQIISNAKLIIKDNDNVLVFIEQNRSLYHAVIKSTRDGKELFITSFRYTDKKDVSRIKKKGIVLKDELVIN